MSFLGACRRKTRSTSLLRAHTGARLRYSGPMKTFKPYNPDQPFLLPPVLQDWLPEDHSAAFISEVVDAALDLTPILATYETGDGRGQPPTTRRSW